MSCSCGARPERAAPARRPAGSGTPGEEAAVLPTAHRSRTASGHRAAAPRPRSDRAGGGPRTSVVRAGQVADMGPEPYLPGGRRSPLVDGEEDARVHALTDSEAATTPPPGPIERAAAAGVPSQIVRGGFLRLAVAVLGATVLSTVVSAVVQLLVDAAPFPYPSIVPMAVATAVTVLLTGGLLAALVRRRWRRGTEVAAVVALAALATAVLALPLHG